MSDTTENTPENDGEQLHPMYTGLVDAVQDEFDPAEPRIALEHAFLAGLSAGQNSMISKLDAANPNTEQATVAAVELKDLMHLMLAQIDAIEAQAARDLLAAMRLTRHFDKAQSRALQIQERIRTALDVAEQWPDGATTEEYLEHVKNAFKEAWTEGNDEFFTR